MYEKTEYETNSYIFLQEKSALEPVVIELDLADKNQFELFIQKVHDICGKIDILINNGGVSHRDSVMNTKMDVFEKIMNINYFGSVALTKGMPVYFSKPMRHFDVLSIDHFA